ncbi:hypothetical protein Har1130_02475 [Haloarcula sp. CBA1130]|uniref:hypothetical protein n=1 Tax=unclassified Haloarcula TaxID=2624677 RepID=UPI001248BD22|nr:MULTISPECIES: hypothetical protein [unclassified Haloarcula]KAA9399965.1 hypothetical protein Har1129_17750 [Haloarcula sp. CBA1129]KAA9401660.1 hypothetical protein Har1130_02475 [Haloarcula sp. CBA1130]
MKRTRRATLRLVGGAAIGALSGCLAPGRNSSGDGGTETRTHPSPGTDPDTETDDGHTETATDDETPTDTPDGLPDDLSRVDTPPYEVGDVECHIDDSGEGDRDPLYLCANMASEPSLSFEQESTRGTLFADDGLEGPPDDDQDQLYATLLTEADDIGRFGDDSGDAYSLAADTDFGTHAALVVQTGWGSGSIVPHVKRIEETADGVHAFGCYTQPCVYTSDFTARTTVARFERPDALDSGVVSLTVDPSMRYNVATGEGVVTIDRLE